MTEGTKNKIGIGAMIIIVLAFLGYCGIVIAEFYVSRYGQSADAKVIDTSDLCRRKNKHLTLLINGDVKRVKIYGIACRIEDFPMNSIVKIKKNDFFDIVTVPNNYGTVRLILFPVMLILSVVGLIELLKQHKKLTAKLDTSQTD